MRCGKLDNPCSLTRAGGGHGACEAVSYAAMASEFLSSSLGAFDMMWAHQCREQDMAHRRIENRRRAIDDARRTLDMKVQQLKAISHLSALVS